MVMKHKSDDGQLIRLGIVVACAYCAVTALAVTGECYKEEVIGMCSAVYADPTRACQKPGSSTTVTCNDLILEDNQWYRVNQATAGQTGHVSMYGESTFCKLKTRYCLLDANGQQTGVCSTPVVQFFNCSGERENTGSDPCSVGA